MHKKNTEMLHKDGRENMAEANALNALKSIAILWPKWNQSTRISTAGWPYCIIPYFYNSVNNVDIISTLYLHLQNNGNGPCGAGTQSGGG